jgi:XTP/dITP diphosphohydrolase
LPTISDDSGIQVEALKGKPGIYSSRFASKDIKKKPSDQENYEKLLSCLSSKTNKKASYYCVIVYMRHEKDPTPLIAEGAWTGEIIQYPRGNKGFGYDPIFYCPQLKKTAAEMSAIEKSSVSHRGKALKQLSKQLRRFIPISSNTLE